MTDLIETAPHEFHHRYAFDDGLASYYAVVAANQKQGGGTTLTVDPDQWDSKLRVSFNYEECGIERLNHPSCDLETIREYRLKWEFLDDNDHLSRSGSFLVTPRTPDMVDSDGDKIWTPEGGKDVVGVGVRCKGSNLPFDEYLPLLQECARAVGINPQHFTDPHEEASRTIAAEKYVRIDEDEAGRLHAIDGVLHRLSNLLANDRSGYRSYKADDRKCPGWNHETHIGPKRASEAVPHHRIVKAMKLYHMRDPDAQEGPTSNPKLGVRFSSKAESSEGRGSILLDEFDRLERELDELLLNILHWEDYPVTAEDIGEDGGPYVADDYFEPTASHRQRRLVSDPTPELKDHQESLVTKHLVDGVEDGDFALLETLATDGGEVAPKDVADRHDVHPSTVYTAIDRMENLVEHTYGELQFSSHKVGTRIVEAIQHAQSATEDAMITTAKALEQAASMERMTDALAEWADEHDVDISDEPGQEMEIEVGRGVSSTNELIVALTKGLAVWRRAGYEGERFKRAVVSAPSARRGTMMVRNVLALR